MRPNSMRKRLYTALELKIPPLLLTALILILMLLSKKLFPEATFTLPWHRSLGSLSAALGLMAMLGAAWQFRQRHTTLNPRDPGLAQHFVVQGWYRLSRNPMYLGMALILAGGALWMAHAIAVALVPLFGLYLTELQIKPEERMLQQRFGDEYKTYQTQVRRWI